MEKTVVPSPGSFASIPAKAVVGWGVLPVLRRDDGSVEVLTFEPSNLEALENMSALLGCSVVPVPVSPDEFQKKVRARYGLGAAALDELSQSSLHLDETKSRPEARETAMVRFVNDLIRHAHRDRATDIHIEPYEDDVQVRFRVDGLLRTVPLSSEIARYRSALISRIKVMAQMNIAEKRLPQDGRIRFALDGAELDLRVSTLPTIHGESLDIRLLPKGRLAMGLAELGMPAAMQQTMANLIRKPNGILLVTGPTGHGKTTTLYACLSQINAVDKKIITVEDPVEIRMRGVNQLQVHPKIGLSFASGLRSILRQDPDVIMIGEIRDKDTAEIAIRSSLTGHLVFSTLHTNDAVGAVTRLVDMGIEPYLVASSVNAVLAQRLARVTCAPCEECQFTGFRGRTGIFELFVMDESARRAILERKSEATLREIARANGMRPMFEDGMRKAVEGITSREEVMRVTEDV